MQPHSYAPLPPDDEEYLRKLSVAHYVYAGLQLFFVLFGLTFFGFAVAMIAQPEWFQGAEPPAVLTNAFFMGMGLAMSLAFIGFAYLTYRAGRSIALHRNYGLCIGVAAFNVLSMPLGTLLGIATIVILSRPGVKTMFGR